MKNPAHLFRKEVREGNWYNINEQALFNELDFRYALRK
jgi:hypothetical protein